MERPMTQTESIRGMATLLALHLAAWDATITHAPRLAEGLADLRGMTIEALRDAQRHLPQGEVERIMAGVRRGAERAAKDVGL